MRGPGQPVELVVRRGRRGRGGRDRRRDQGLDGLGPSGRERQSPPGPSSPSSTASTSIARRSSRGCATRGSRTRSSAACRCSRRPEIRDLEQSLRAIADPTPGRRPRPDDVGRPVAARRDRDPPDRADGALRPAPPDRGRPRGRRVRPGRRSIGSGPTDEEVPTGPASTDDGTGRRRGAGGGLALQPPATTSTARGAPDVAADRRETRRIDVAPDTRAKLRRLLRTLDELTPLTWREGPLTVLEQFVDPDRPRPRPRRGRHPRVEAHGRQHRELHALRRRTGSRSTRAAASPGSSTTSTPTRAPAATCRRASS